MKKITLALLLIFTGITFGQTYESFNQKLSKDQKEQAIYIEKNIMATCCFGGPVYMHGKNQKTEDAKIDIRRLLLEEKSTDEILDYFRNSIDSRTGQPYGNRILASPKASETVGRVSYWMVAGFFVIGLALLAMALKKLRAQKGTTPPQEDLPADTLKKIESELSELD